MISFRLKCERLNYTYSMLFMAVFKWNAQLGFNLSLWWTLGLVCHKSYFYSYSSFLDFFFQKKRKNKNKLDSPIYQKALFAWTIFLVEILQEGIYFPVFPLLLHLEEILLLLVMLLHTQKLFLTFEMFRFLFLYYIYFIQFDTN